jgi:hypothetical protein
MGITVPPDSTGKTVETNSPDGSTQRQVVTVGDSATAAGVAKVQNADPASSDYGVTVRNPRGNATLPQRIDPTGTTTQPVSVASLPLPSGAATSAKQPALGTAGSPSADVISVQGIASMTPVKVDGSAVTQPVSGTFWQATQPVSGTVTSNQGTAAASTAGWPVTNGTVAAVTAAWTSATALNTAQSIVTTGYSIVEFSLNATSTMTGGVLTFEASDDAGVTWYSIQAARVNAPNIETTFTLSVTTQAWQANIAGFTNFRVRLSTVITGSGTANLRLQASASGESPDLSVQGTVSINAIPTGSNVIGHVIADSGSTTVVTGTVAVTESGTWNVGSSTATGSAVPANAFYKGGIAKTALPAAATDGNLTGTMLDKFGRQVCLLGSIRDLTGTQTTTISASTAETTIATAGAAGIFNDLVMLIVSNTSAATNTRIDFRDTTGGSILFSLFSVGGAAPVGFALPIPIPQTTAATNWTAQCATSTTDVRVYAVFVRNK